MMAKNLMATVAIIAHHALLLGTASPTLASAQAMNDYRCVIERVDTASAPDSKNIEFLRKIYIGKTFIVERQTGLMEGAGALKNYGITRPEVIDPGSNVNSFMVVTTLRKGQGAGVGSNVHVLVVNEWEASARKSFVYLHNRDMYIGVCTHV